LLLDVVINRVAGVPRVAVNLVPHRHGYPPPAWAMISFHTLSSSSLLFYRVDIHGLSGLESSGSDANPQRVASRKARQL
jgi:hypothetical protein